MIFREENTVVVKKIPAVKLPVGRNTWTVNTGICDNSGESISASLTPCKNNQFTCNSGKCTDLEYRCDIYHDCEDGEDEEGCVLLELSDDYKSQVAPRHLQKGVPWPIYLSVEIVSFPEILAVDQRVRVVFILSLRWYDSRLEFQNLKKGKFENPLDPATIGELWIPRLGLL